MTGWQGNHGAPKPGETDPFIVMFMHHTAPLRIQCTIKNIYNKLITKMCMNKLKMSKDRLEKYLKSNCKISLFDY